MKNLSSFKLVDLLRSQAEQQQQLQQQLQEQLNNINSNGLPIITKVIELITTSSCIVLISYMLLENTKYSYYIPPLHVNPPLFISLALLITALLIINRYYHTSALSPELQFGLELEKFKLPTLRIQRSRSGSGSGSKSEANLARSAALQTLQRNRTFNLNTPANSGVETPSSKRAMPFDHHRSARSFSLIKVTPPNQSISGEDLFFNTTSPVSSASLRRLSSSGSAYGKLRSRATSTSGTCLTPPLNRLSGGQFQYRNFSCSPTPISSPNSIFPTNTSITNPTASDDSRLLFMDPPASTKLPTLNNVYSNTPSKSNNLSHINLYRVNSVIKRSHSCVPNPRPKVVLSMSSISSPDLSRDSATDGIHECHSASSSKSSSANTSRSTSPPSSPLLSFQSDSTSPVLSPVFDHSFDSYSSMSPMPKLTVDKMNRRSLFLENYEHLKKQQGSSSNERAGLQISSSSPHRRSLSTSVTQQYPQRQHLFSTSRRRNFTLDISSESDNSTLGHGHSQSVDSSVGLGLGAPSSSNSVSTLSFTSLKNYFSHSSQGNIPPVSSTGEMTLRPLRLVNGVN
ncbi:unnamed protein product [Ambrosiozyma monospora]|uniref:Unnamed protein product n=1 Tax=Ambrosiozyma monospora TaxID=43982 RepID=A0A9W7DKH1_AMBMO|nr:unnamed protein product [Ambrosiozyma monospora]